MDILTFYHIKTPSANRRQKRSIVPRLITFSVTLLLVISRLIQGFQYLKNHLRLNCNAPGESATATGRGQVTWPKYRLAG